MAQPRAHAGANKTGKKMAIVTVTAAIAALKNTIDVAKSAIATRDELKLAEMQQSINDRVIDVQNAALALQEKQSNARDEIDQLKESLRQANETISTLEKERTDRNQYKLTPIAHSGHAYQYAVSGENPHFICQPCFDGPEKRKVVLQFSPRYQGFASTWMCSVCKTVIRGD
ncbi:MAG: hypothetical protein OSB38_30465 [Paraburkholderia fungorum]|nr:hypothetical protein [Paraburkholderia fungorum]